MKSDIPEGYKNSPVGVIPDEWEAKRLEEIAEIKSGTTPLRSIEDYFFKGNIPWVKTTDLNNGLLYETEEKVTQKALDETSLRILPKGTVLVAMYGGFNQIGRTALLTLDATINQALSALLLNKTIADNLFILYWLNHNVGSWKRYAASSRKDPNITSRDVALFQTPLPPLNEQQKIAEILSVWDVAIEKQTLLIEKLELRKRALMQQLLTGKKRIKGFNGKVKKQQLKSYLLEISSRNSNNRINNVLSVTNSRGFISQSEQFERVVASEDVSKYKIVRKGQFAYNPSRINVGSLDMLKHVDCGILSPMYIVFETNKEHLNSNFLYYHLKSENFTKRIPMYVQGSVRDSLSFDSLTAMKFYIPSLTEQIAIAEILSTADQGIHIAKEKLEQFKKQKKGLMQVLLTGKKRVITTTNT